MKKAKLKRENKRMKRNGYAFKPSDTAKFKLWPREGLYGHFVEVQGWTEYIIYRAKQILYTRSYLYIKVRLRKYAGVELQKPKWIEKKNDDWPTFYIRSAGTVGWKACADKPVSNEAYRRMEMAEKRARMQIHGKKDAGH